MLAKKQKVKSLRNVLVSPFNIKWSESNAEDAASLKKTLLELLPLAKLEDKNLNTQFKVKRKRKEKSLPISSVEKHSNIFRTYLSPGFQSVIRGLEKDDLCCVLLSSDISPPMIQRVVCGYCKTYDVPLIVVSDLKNIAKSTLGFPTMVLGFKKMVESPENSFNPIYELVSQNPCVFQTSFVVKHKENRVTERDNGYTVSNIKSIASSAENKITYLYRERVEERAFSPGIGIDDKGNFGVNSATKDNIEDFISFGKCETKSIKVKHHDKSSKKIVSQRIHENDDSDSDSLDEDNIFFIDDKPDQSWLQTNESNNEQLLSHAKVDFIKNQETSSSCKNTFDSTRKVKGNNERYFSSSIKKCEDQQKFRKKKNKAAKQKHMETVKPERTESEEKFTTKFKPMDIKTIISNPKKFRRKKDK